MRESGFPQLEYKLWSVFVGPAGMPRNVVEVLNRATNQAYADAAILELVAKFGQEPGVGTPEDVARTIEREYSVLTKLIKDTGVKLE
jgi:tripartite-type tricarboxylate transporter receptor subunit TctC